MYPLYVVPEMLSLIFKAILLDQKFSIWKENDNLFSEMVYVSVKCWIVEVVTSTPANHYRGATRSYQIDILKTVMRLSYITQHSALYWKGGFDSRQGLEIFFYSTGSRSALGPTQPPIQWVLSSSSPGLNWPGHEADRSSLSNAKVKNGGAIPPLPNKI
jgi:hypothetical protein